MNNLTSSQSNLTQLDGEEQLRAEAAPPEPGEEAPEHEKSEDEKTEAGNNGERRLDRRGILRFGGAATLAGAAAALMGSSAAGAATGVMHYGTRNAAAESTTGLTSWNSKFTLRARNEGLGHAIVGEATNADGSGFGVLGTGVGGAGVVGGTKGDGPGVRAYVQPGAKGSALQALTLEPTNSSPTVMALQGGIGHGLYSHIENEANAGQAIYGRTAGRGHALLASVVNGGSSAAALKATTEGSGPGIEAVSNVGVGATFKGRTAQVQLIPSSAASHPAEGSSGQLFVDASHRLWYCQGGTDWHRLA